jgi:hypothetical protein
MKTALLAALLLLTAGAAQADVIALATPGVRNEFVTRYNLDSFKIASSTLRLSGPGEIARGTVAINEATRELRLTLTRHLPCPHGVMCIGMIPSPTVITLPIREMHSEMCGGVTIVAERNLQLVDGGLTRVEVQDANGGFPSCGGNADDATFVKRVKVLVTEEGLLDRTEALSVMSGLPLGR